MSVIILFNRKCRWSLFLEIIFVLKLILIHDNTKLHGTNNITTQPLTCFRSRSICSPLRWCKAVFRSRPWCWASTCACGHSRNQGWPSRDQSYPQISHTTKLRKYLIQEIYYIKTYSCDKQLYDGRRKCHI